MDMKIERVEKKNLAEKFRDFLERWPAIHKLYCQYEEILVYLVVGVLTTIFSWGVCFIVERFFLDSSDDIQNLIINTIGWIAGVCFAYPLNRSWVFRSHNPQILKEFSGFAASRLSTWILDLLIMWVTVNYFGMHYWIAKIFISSVVVTILNYVFSKILIFSKKEKVKK
ncbi:MAG: GtrA family protein [Lachnospiraceae bacterium]|nr:GtrA family protein [Lachnospiraceae bacterium]